MKATAIEIHAAKHALRKEMGWHWGGAHTRMWHGLPRGILGIGFGVKRKKGKVKEAECIRVYVSRKWDEKDLSEKQLIPDEINGFPTDVIAAKRIYSHPGPGGSISNSQGVSGSLACVVQDSAARYLLGSWHVFTNVYGKDGDPVYMPSKNSDGDAPIAGSLVATPIFHLNGGSNAFDASVAIVSADVTVDTTFTAGVGFGACCLAVTGSTVFMQGAVSGQMQGTVNGVSEDIVVMYNGSASERAVLTGQIAIVGVDGDFSTEGDSGALIYTADMQPIGILVGGSQTDETGTVRHSFASPIQTILDFYQVSIAT